MRAQYFPTIATFSESISAGFPSAAEGFEDEPLDLHRWLVRHPAATFLFRVRGDALRDEHIRDGSLLIVDRSIKPSDRKLVVAEQEGEFVIFRYRADCAGIICGVVVGLAMRF